LTYASIGVFAPRLFTAERPVHKALFPWLYGVVDAGRVSGERFEGRWSNVGTPSDLAQLERELAPAAGDRQVG
jgi:MurNAc alpha-1-phosphate uridylyltransferase